MSDVLGNGAWNNSCGLGVDAMTRSADDTSGRARAALVERGIKVHAGQDDIDMWDDMLGEVVCLTS